MTLGRFFIQYNVIYRMVSTGWSHYNDHRSNVLFYSGLLRSYVKNLGYFRSLKGRNLFKLSTWLHCSVLGNFKEFP